MKQKPIALLLPSGQNFRSSIIHKLDKFVSIIQSGDYLEARTKQTKLQTSTPYFPIGNSLTSDITNMNRQKYIRPLPLLIILLALISCESTKKKTGFLPKEYSYPIEQIGNGKTLVYRKVGATNQTSFKDLQLITEPGGQFLLSKQYSADAKFDSSKTTIDNKLIETFTFLLSDTTDNKQLPIKGEIKEDKVIDNGTKFGQSVYKIVYTGNENVVTISSVEEYLKDTILTWQDEQLDCIVTSMKSKIEFSNTTNPFAKQEIEYKGDSYFAKGIGLIRYTSQTKNDFSIWELIESKDTK